MKAEGLVSDFAFTGNPIVLRESPDQTITDPLYGSFYVRYGDRNIYEGRLDPSLPLEVNISEIVDAAVQFIPEAKMGYDPVVVVEDMDALDKRRVYASFSWNNAETEFECFAFPGGVSRQNFRTYLRDGEDSFGARFLNHKANFFLTTRSVGWEIAIKETELSPLYFICNGTGTLKVVERCRNCQWLFDQLDWGVFALDVKALRYEFFDEFDVLPSVLDIYRDDSFSCRIIVTEVDPAKEHYRIKFRNSLGCFDIIDLAGVASIGTGEVSDEENEFNRYDPQLDDYRSERLRISATQTITIATMLNIMSDMTLFRDMLASDEVYLLDVPDGEVKVIPECEDLTYDIRSVSPKPISVKLTVADPEAYIMPPIGSVRDHRKPRLFTNKFTEQFN